jgi:hypothetical protein
MKTRIFLYLFLFALLFIIFQYMNEKSIFERQEQQIESLEVKLEAYDSLNDVFEDRIAELNYFTLLGNDNAMTYLEKLGMEAEEVQGIVSEAIYESNLTEENPLIPVASQDGKMKINALRFLNHRWVIADFTDGTYWGEVIIDYFFDENEQLLLTPVTTVLYPN